MYGSPRHGTQTTICAHDSAAAGTAPSLRTHPPPHPAQMLHGPAHALVAMSITRTMSHPVLGRSLRVIAHTSTARLGVGP